MSGLRLVGYGVVWWLTWTLLLRESSADTACSDDIATCLFTHRLPLAGSLFLTVGSIASPNVTFGQTTNFTCSTSPNVSQHNATIWDNAMMHIVLEKKVHLAFGCGSENTVELSTDTQGQQLLDAGRIYRRADNRSGICTNQYNATTFVDGATHFVRELHGPLPFLGWPATPANPLVYVASVPYGLDSLKGRVALPVVWTNLYTNTREYTYPSTQYNEWTLLLCGSSA